MPPGLGADDANSPAKHKVQVPEPVGNFPNGAEFFPRRALVVDDEPLIRWSVSETLTELGCEVEQAADAGAAMKAVSGSTRQFDVVVLDLRLPDMKDLSLLESLRAMLPGAALVVMSAMVTPDIISSALALGATVLHKPFELEALRDLVPGNRTEK